MRPTQPCSSDGRLFSQRFGEITFVFNREEETPMNKQELIDAVESKSGSSNATAEEAIKAVSETISKTVAAGDTVQLIGF
ncbi:hypothetical protein YK56LOC_33830 [Caballeronia sp. HLA56]